MIKVEKAPEGRSLQALKFTLGSAAPHAVQLDLASRQALAQSLAGDETAALVIRRSEHGKLRGFADLIVDRGDKHSQRELARLVWGGPHSSTVFGLG